MAGERLEARLAKIEQAVAHLVDVVERGREIERIGRVLDGLGALLAILAIAGLEAFALHKDVDGTFFLPVVALISALGGAKLKDVLGDILRRR